MAGRRVDLDRSARDRESIAHADEAAALRSGARVEAGTVVTDLEADVARVLPDLDRDARVRWAVLGCVLERFERREVASRLNILAVPPERAASVSAAPSPRSRRTAG